MRTIRNTAGLATLLAGLALAAQAQESAVKIRLVEADPQMDAIRLEGANLAVRGAQTSVYLAGYEQPLKLYRLTENEVRATLPARLESGTYTVRLTRGSQPGETHEAPLTVGIVGPIVQDN